jgi:hypothetical protein
MRSWDEGQFTETSSSFHVFVICFFRSHSLSRSFIGRIFAPAYRRQVHYNHPSVCQFGSCSISDTLRLIFQTRYEVKGWKEKQ